MIDEYLRSMSDQELASEVFGRYEPTELELELARRLMDSALDLKEAKEKQCTCD